MVVNMQEEKVALPLYVCRWVDKCKNEKLGIRRLIQPFRTADGNRVNKWIDKNPDKHLQMLTQAWNNGYVADDTTQYRVQFDNGMFLAMDVDGNLSITDDLYGKSIDFDIEELEEIDKLILGKSKLSFG